MDSQWQSYGDHSSGHPGHHDTSTSQNPYRMSTKYNGQQQAQAPAGYTYESYQSPIAAAQASSGGSSSKPVSMASSPAATPHTRDYFTDVDTPMEDADPYNRAKYSSRANHNTRPSSQYMPTEESTAARRYSPMNILSPTLPYSSSPTKSSQNPFTAPPSGPNSSRQSPTRASVYASPPQGYQSPPGSRAPRLPVLQSTDMSPEQYFPSSATSQLSAPFGSDLKSPPTNQSTNHKQVPGRGPIPKFSSIKSMQELKPRINTQPAFRRANPEGGFISPLQALTTHLPATYRICNPTFKYESSRNPRRVLTKPSKGVKNDGFDNEDSDYILYVNDILGSEDGGHNNRYLILDVLGQGTFGQVVKCQNLKTQEVVAVKVVKNKTAYFNQSMMEVSVLDLLNKKYDKNDDHHLLRLKDTFLHRQHLCLVFELLSVNLYELIKQNQFRGLSTTLVRVFAQQLLNGLSLLNKARLIHCDLKPENILLKNLESPIIKIIDFGSACDERQTVYTYIQSRFYRSPEVLLGLPYSSAIDMWSLGCIVVELFLGLPLFPGSSEYNQVARITEMLGLPPTWMLEMGKQSGEFFEKTQDEFGRKTWRLKSMEQYSREHNTKEQPSKKYFQANTLEEIIRSYAMPRKNMKQSEIEREVNNRVAFIDFVRGLLQINPLERWSPQQAKLHPFITQQKFTGPFVPPMNLKFSALNKSIAPGIQQQQQAEAASKQRAAQAAQAAQAQAQSAAQSAYAMQMGQYHSPSHNQAPPVYNGMYPAHQQGAPPPYPAQPPGYGHQMGMMQGQMQPQYPPSQSLYAQATTRAGRQRATTLDPQQGGIPPTIQRVASHLDPNAPIRLQPSPAYYPPPPDGYADTAANSRRRGSRAGAGHRNRDFIRTLEDGALGDGFMGQNQWH
ncbi:protein kinase Yak1, putative [Talaromyces stipitatus ATCC 10500]|uniref:Protein kinase Yak1, putative n=1 Tax=Talaromyces stipitatus (strain ATCC 10500 / CBS 375.48 / QM 6759 / NRRL 1006) TaxID=441959 RepID=B8MAY2_TALSN|nr:protein kinase Yak1, putative [Talaromyces stipitatus ATCC 10500]EED18683.1 protein kinase Yak1, putative [Talaromyces stipitatus ATCC 10500]